MKPSSTRRRASRARGATGGCRGSSSPRCASSPCRTIRSEPDSGSIRSSTSRSDGSMAGDLACPGEHDGPGATVRLHQRDRIGVGLGIAGTGTRGEPALAPAAATDDRAWLYYRPQPSTNEAETWWSPDPPLFADAAPLPPTVAPSEARRRHRTPISQPRPHLSGRRRCRRMVVDRRSARRPRRLRRRHRTRPRRAKTGTLAVRPIGCRISSSNPYRSVARLSNGWRRAASLAPPQSRASPPLKGRQNPSREDSAWSPARAVPTTPVRGPVLRVLRSATRPGRWSERH